MVWQMNISTCTHAHNYTHMLAHTHTNYYQSTCILTNLCLKIHFLEALNVCCLSAKKKKTHQTGAFRRPTVVIANCNAITSVGGPFAFKRVTTLVLLSVAAKGSESNFGLGDR